MNKYISDLIYSISLVIFSIISISLAIMFLARDYDLALWIRICASITLIAITLSMITLKMLKINLWTKILFICDILAVCTLIGYYIIWANNWLQYFSSVDAIKELILSTGVWGQIVFVVIQFLQVVALPIPAMVSTLAGTAIYGPFLTFILSTIGIILGSLVAFLIGRLFGRKVIEWIAGKETTMKYAKMLNDKGKFMLPIIFLLPVFPDDIICMVAGITTMSFRFFMISTIIVRPIGILVTCYVGSGELIPFHGWGLYVWPFLILLLIFAFWFCYKYQSQIEKFFNDKIMKIGKKNKDNINIEIDTLNNSCLKNDTNIDMNNENKEIRIDDKDLVNKV